MQRELGRKVNQASEAFTMVSTEKHAVQAGNPPRKKRRETLVPEAHLVQALSKFEALLSVPFDETTLNSDPFLRSLLQQLRTFSWLREQSP